MPDRKSGFTLVELVIVIVILGILVGIAIPRYIGLRAKAEEAAEKAVVANVKESIALAHASFKLNTYETEYSGVAFNPTSGYPTALDDADAGPVSTSNPFLIMYWRIMG